MSMIKQALQRIPDFHLNNLAKMVSSFGRNCSLSQWQTISCWLEPIGTQQVMTWIPPKESFQEKIL